MKIYGALELTAASTAQRSTPEVIKLSEVKDYLRIDQDVTAQDNVLVRFIAGARTEAERLQGKDLTPKQYDLNLDLLIGDGVLIAADPLRSLWTFGAGNEIELRHPLQTVDLFQRKDSSGNITVLVDGTDYIVDKNRSLVTPPYGQIWPFFFAEYPSSAVLIRFTSGYPANHPFWLNAGSKIMIGMWMLISHWYENRDVLNGAASSEYPYSITELLSGGARPRVF